MTAQIIDISFDSQHNRRYTRLQLPEAQPSASMALRRPLTKHLSTSFSLSRHSLRTHSSVSANELSHFSALASSWWDPMGSSRVLHLMNPLRYDFIASCLAEGAPAASPSPNNLRYLDVGCGGGIFAESLARTIPQPQSQSQSQSQPQTDTEQATPTRAASITAIDPTSTLIQIARDHARSDPKVAAHLATGKFQYRNCTLEDLVRARTQASPAETHEHDTPFDVVTLFEVLEHIDTNASSSPRSFLADCLRLVRPGGWLIGSTISRSLPSWIVNQVIAEAPWPVGVVPRGTHDWAKFVNPEELRGWLGEGLERVRMDLDRGQSSREGQGTMQYKCDGVMYFPGLGWRIVPGSADWGNYFWAVRRV